MACPYKVAAPCNGACNYDWWNCGSYQAAIPAETPVATTPVVVLDPLSASFPLDARYHLPRKGETLEQALLRLGGQPCMVQGWEEEGTWIIVR